MSLSRMQVLSIGMIFFVGVMSNNPKHASWGLWTIFGTTALGAVIAGMYVLVIASDVIVMHECVIIILQCLLSLNFEE